MKKSLILVSTILMSISCNLFQDDDSLEKMPSGWSKVEGLKGSLVSTFFTNKERIYAGKQAQGISYSDKTTVDWKTINNGLDEIDHDNTPTLDRKTVRTFVEIGGELYAGIETSVGVGGYEGTEYEFVGGVYELNEDNESWEYLGFKELQIDEIVVMNEKIIAGTYDGVYLLEEKDGVWTNTEIGLDEYSINSIAIIDSNIFVATGWGLFKSSDIGLTWIDIHTGLIRDNYIRNVHSVGNKLFVGNSDGIFISNDNGGNWIEINSGIPYDNMTGYSSISRIVHTDSTIMAIFSLDTYFNWDDTSTRINTGIVYKQLDDLNWKVVEFQGEVNDYNSYFELFSIGIIENKILVGLMKGGFGSTNNEAWINSMILDEN